MEVVDNQSIEATDTSDQSLDNESEIQEASPSDVTQQDSDSDELNQEVKKQVPFQNGKEKFKVNGTEVEWDWETTKKYAQIGNAGYKAMERAAAVEKKAADTYKQLMNLAQSDPEGLIRVFNPNYKPLQARNSQQDAYGQAEQQEMDPRDQKIQELEKQLSTVSERLEKQALDEERKAVQAEIDSAVKAYPILNDEIAINYLKTQYKQALAKGMDVTLDDVAFHVAQKLEESRNKKLEQQKQRIEEKRKRAPVTSTPGTPSSEAKKFQTFDEVRRLAGLLSEG